MMGNGMMGNGMMGNGMMGNGMMGNGMMGNGMMGGGMMGGGMMGNGMGGGGMMGNGMMGDMGMNAGPMLDHMLQRLNLPAATRTKIDDIFYDARKRAIPLRTTIEQAYAEVQHQLTQETPDANAVMKQLDTAGQARTELTKVWMKARLDALKLLTPEQRAQLRQHMRAGGPMM